MMEYVACVQPSSDVFPTLLPFLGVRHRFPKVSIFTVSVFNLAGCAFLLLFVFRSLMSENFLRTAAIPDERVPY